MRALRKMRSCLGMQDHRKLLVFQKARTLAIRVDETMRDVSRRDHSGFATQARRAALSIPSNIAEGCGRRTNRELARFIHVAIGSANELEYQLEYATDTKRMRPDVGEELRRRTIEVRRMLYGLLKKLDDAT